MKNDNKILWALIIVIVLTLVVTIVYFKKEQDEIKKEISYKISELSLKISDMRSDIYKIRKNNDVVQTPSGSNFTDILSMKKMQKKLTDLKKEMENIKKESINKVQSGIEQKQVNLIRDANKSFMKNWEFQFSGILQKVKLNDAQKADSMHDYTRLLRSYEDIQLRWLQGDLSWDELVSEMKYSAITFYDDLSGHLPKKKADKIFIELVPDANLRRQIFEQ